MCMSIFYVLLFTFIHFIVEKMEADLTTTSDLDETISYNDNNSDSDPTFIYEESSVDNEQSNE